MVTTHIYFEKIVKETGKAYLVTLDRLVYGINYVKNIWIPKSQIGFEDQYLKGNGMFQVPKWLWRKINSKLPRW